MILVARSDEKHPPNGGFSALTPPSSIGLVLFVRLPQPWRSLGVCLFVAFWIVFVIGLVTDVSDGVVTGLLLGIIAIQIGLGIYARRRGLIEQPQTGGRRRWPRTSGGRAALGAAVGLGIGLVITALNGGFDTGGRASDDTVGANPHPPPGVVTNVRSPAGVVCRLTAKEARCGVVEFNFTPPSGPSSCPEGHPYVVGVAAGPPIFGCQLGLPAEEDAPPMPTDGSITHGPISCSNALAGGVRCVSKRTRSNHGFILSGENLRVF